jgi:hypothetical protein
MSNNNKLMTMAVGLAMLAAPAFGAAVEAKAMAKAHHRHFIHGPLHAYVRRSPDGDPIDKSGWRLRDGVWDNSCFPNLDYLSSQFACSTGGNRR